ncbi:hypothetical protein AcV5_009737 [Taiwanofungus camphoratus]|nr:hypothetical protein AcV5_009737 [Antrodia cinnamomea]KAI0942797.1 hypothetical protein AcV7_002107 [Antrodia cinnamomea]
MSTSLVVFWPIDIACSGFCYGWTSPIICVAGVLQGYSRGDAEVLLTSISSSGDWDVLRNRPRILGLCEFAENKNVNGGLPNPSLQLESGSGILSRTYQIVYYKRPRRDLMQFYSFDFRELDILPAQHSHDAVRRYTLDEGDLDFKHDFTRPSFSSSFDSGVLNQLNLAQVLVDVVEQSRVTHQAHKRSAELRDLARSCIASSCLAWPQTFIDHVLSHQPMRVFVMVFHSTWDFVKDRSVTIEQLDIRFEQACFVFKQVPILYLGQNASSVKSISRYIKFYNCIWLIFNDIIVGVAFGSFLIENKLVLSRMLGYFLQRYLVKSMQDALLWLNNWPAGLKLNTELSQFFCYTLLGIISAWGRVLDGVLPYLPTLTLIVGAMGCCGMTMVVSLLSDTLSILTAHLYVCYLMSTTVFRHLISLIGSLWNLFRGKRYNVLRNRLDSWDYDIDQLLLGTMLFTLVAFLYPTVLTYYAFFATTRVLTILLHAALDTVSALLNHFPLFAFMLRIKDPMRLPGRIHFVRSADGSLILKNEAIPLSSIFMHYTYLWSRLSSHYHPLHLIRQLISGRQLTPIARSSIRLSMIPTQLDKEPVISR